MHTKNSTAGTWFGEVPAGPFPTRSSPLRRGVSPGCFLPCRLQGRPLLLLLTLMLLSLPALLPVSARAAEHALEPIITELSGYEDRSSGSAGSARAAAYIFEYFENLGLAPQTYHFQLPVRKRIHALYHGG